MKLSISIRDEQLKRLLTDATAPYLSIGSHSVSIVDTYAKDVKAADRVIVICDEDEFEVPEGAVALHRPLSLADLREAVLTPPAKGDDTSVTESTFFYDKSLRLLSKNECSVTLTPREADIFELLLSHKGSPVSREALKGVFPDSEKDSNAADVYVSYLRRKLKCVFGDGALISIRGVGYILKI